jgi:carbonic anhydrase
MCCSIGVALFVYIISLEVYLPRSATLLFTIPTHDISHHSHAPQTEHVHVQQGPKAHERLEWDVRRGLSIIKNHPWIPTTGPDAIVSIRGFIYDVDTGLLTEVQDGPKGAGI